MQFQHQIWSKREPNPSAKLKVGLWRGGCCSAQLRIPELSGNTRSQVQKGLTTEKLLQPNWTEVQLCAWLLQKHRDLKATMWWCHIWGTYREIGQKGRWKCNLESNYSSESKTSKELLRAENELTESSRGPDSTQRTKYFWEILQCFLKLYNPSNRQSGTLLWRTERSKSSRVFPWTEEEKERLQPYSQSQEWLFSHYYKHLVSMEGGYLAANIGNQRHSTPTISSAIAEKKIIIIIIK